MQAGAKVFVAGHRGLVGSALVRRLQKISGLDLVLRDRSQLDLVNQAAVERFFAETQPDYVFMAAARVGGIKANDGFPAEFLRDNLAIETNVLHAAYVHRVKKFLFLGSSCVYPRLAPQPLREEYLLTGPLETTNEWYAVAKIAGVKLCQAYRRQYGFDAISVMPTNLYGPGDNFSLGNAHVLPALMRKLHEAKLAGGSEIEVWGTGKPRREFMHADDLADACVFLMENYSEEGLINIGWGEDVSIAEAASIMARVVGFHGGIRYNTSMPDGTPRKLLEVSRLSALGWKAKIPLEQGLADTYEWFLKSATHRE